MTVESSHRFLYHYTALANVASIFAARELRTSPVPCLGSRFGRSVDVVWLTDADDPGRDLDHGLGIGPVDPAEDKRGVRFTVAVPDAQYWRRFAVKRGVGARTRRELDEDGGRLSARWWVVPRPIRAEEWVRVDDLRTGERFWPDEEYRLARSLTYW